MKPNPEYGDRSDDFEEFASIVRDGLDCGPGGDDPVPFPDPVCGVGNLDRHFGGPPTLAPHERDIVSRVEDRIESDDYALPHLRTTHAELVELVSSPDAQIGRVVRLVSTDVALAALLLRLANGTSGHGRTVDSIPAALEVVGLHGLRALVLTLSLRDIIFRPPWLAACASELWRQSTSIACTARELAVPLCLDPDRMFALGLLHDVGKIPILPILREVATNSPLRPPLVGWLLHRHHEQVGRRLAAAWSLPDEIRQVAGCHHDFEQNVGHRRSAALVHLAHRLDLCLSTGNASDYFALEWSPAMEQIGIDETYRRSLLDACRDSYLVTRAGAPETEQAMEGWHPRAVPYDSRA